MGALKLIEIPQEDQDRMNNNEYRRKCNRQCMCLVSSEQMKICFRKAIFLFQTIMAYFERTGNVPGGFTGRLEIHVEINFP